MYTTYKEYLKQETSLPFEEAMQIWNQIAEQGEADAACRELIDRFLKCAVDYVRIRNGWNQKSLAEKGQADAERTRCHNLVISAKNKLSVYMYEHNLCPSHFKSFCCNIGIQCHILRLKRRHAVSILMKDTA